VRGGADDYMCASGDQELQVKLVIGLPLHFLEHAVGARGLGTFTVKEHLRFQHHGIVLYRDLKEISHLNLKLLAYLKGNGDLKILLNLDEWHILFSSKIHVFKSKRLLVL
jgi:hypothetical protein